jgi:hypothetical protein
VAHSLTARGCQARCARRQSAGRRVPSIIAILSGCFYAAFGSWLVQRQPAHRFFAKLPSSTTSATSVTRTSLVRRRCREYGPRVVGRHAIADRVVSRAARRAVGADPAPHPRDGSQLHRRLAAQAGRRQAAGGHRPWRVPPRLEDRLGAGRVADDVVDVDAIAVEGMWWRQTPHGGDPLFRANLRAMVGGSGERRSATCTSPTARRPPGRSGTEHRAEFATPPGIVTPSAARPTRRAPAPPPGLTRPATEQLRGLVTVLRRQRPLAMLDGPARALWHRSSR